MTWLALLLAAVATAAEMKAPEPVGLHPLLLGDPAVASPLGAALDARARALLAGGPATASEAAARLAPALAGHPTERAAALVSARLLADSAAAEAFFGARPALAQSAAARLPGLATADDPYRGHVGDPRSALGRLSETARRDPATAWLFDGSRPGPELDGVTRRGETLLVRDASKVKLAEEGALRAAAHPRMAGAELVLLPSKDKSDSTLAYYETGARRLADAGAGPRLVATARLHDHDSMSLKPGRHRVFVREAVQGRSVAELAARGEFGASESALVAVLLAKLARARLDPASLSPSAIVIGSTAADPERRALLAHAQFVGSMPEGLTDGQAFERLDRMPVFFGLEHYPAESLKPPREVWLPLGDLLSSMVKEPRPTFMARLAGLLNRGR